MRKFIITLRIFTTKPFHFYTLTPFTRSFTLRKPHESYIEESILLIKENQQSKAIPLLNKAIEMNPLEHRQYSLRGHCYMRLKMYEKAIQDFETLIRVEPTSLVGKLGKAECLRGMKKYDEALKLFDEIIFATNDVAAYYGRGNVYRAINQIEKAVKDFEEVTKRTENVDAYVQAAECYLHLENLEAAERHYKAAEKIDKHNKSVIEGIAFLNSMKDTPEGHRECIKYLSELIKDEQNPNLLTKRALSFYHLGKIQEAKDDCDKALEQTPLDFAYYIRGMCFQQLGDHNNAISDFKAALEIQKSLPDEDPYKQSLQKLLEQSLNAVTQTKRH